MSVREKMLGRRGNVGDALKRPLAVNAAFFFLILFFGGLYFSSKYWSDSKGVQDALKACAGILFVLCCIFNFRLSDGRFGPRRGDWDYAQNLPRYGREQRGQTHRAQKGARQKKGGERPV